MKIKELAELAIELLTGKQVTTRDYAWPINGASCVAVSRAHSELRPPMAGACSVVQLWEIHDRWEHFARLQNGGRRPRWWDQYSPEASDVSLRVEALTRWIFEHGEEEFRP